MSLVDDFDDPLPPRIDWSLWQRYLRRAMALRGGVLGVLAGGLGIAVIESLRPLIVAGLIDEASRGEWTDRLTWLFAAWVVLAIAFAAAVWCFIAAAGRLGAGLAFRLREQAFDKLQRLSFSYFDRRPVGWLLSRITSDCAQVSGRAPWVILDLFWAPLLMGSSAAAMLWLDAGLAGLVLLVVPPLAIVSRFFSRRMVRSARRVRRTNSMMTAFLNEAIAGIRTTKTLGREEAAQAEYTEQTATMRHWSIVNARQGALYTPLLSTITAVGAAVALWLGGEAVRVEGLSVGELVAFCQYALLFAFPVQDLAQRFADLLSAQSAAERIENLLDARIEIADSDEVRRRIAAQAKDPDPRRAEDGGALRLERLALEGVRFRYAARSGAFDPSRDSGDDATPADETAPWTIDDVSLAIPPGQSLALVGPTGGGKTTLASLIASTSRSRAGSSPTAWISEIARSPGSAGNSAWCSRRLGSSTTRFARTSASRGSTPRTKRSSEPSRPPEPRRSSIASKADSTSWSARVASGSRSASVS